MNQAKLYSKYHDLQMRDALYVIENYLKLVKWKNGKGDDDHRDGEEVENILDVGTGDGHVTFDLLLPELPNKFTKLVGVDLSQKMVDFASARPDIKDDRRIRFVQLDISGTEIPIELHGEFDHVFSFYSLHWIPQRRQSQTFRNLYSVMKPGSDMLLLFLASNPMFDVYEVLAENPKWALHMKNLNDYISPYHHSAEPEKELEDLLKDAGFMAHLCRVEDRRFIFENFEMLSNSVKAVSPFLKTMTEEESKSFMADYIEETRNHKDVTIIESVNNNENDEKIDALYKIFVVYASKPQVVF